MATPSSIDFGRQHRSLFRGPTLEVGSLIDPSYDQCSPRDLSPSGDYLGIDIFPGEGVDLVADISTEEGVAAVGANRFNTVHCLSVMEHVPDIFGMARGIQAVLREGGVLYLSVPFSWKLHRIPVDMWRFTPQGVDYLFPQISFKKELAKMSTRGGQMHGIDVAPELAMGTQLKSTLGLGAYIIRGMRRLGLDRGHFSERALLHESNLMMIGVKTAAPSYSFFPSPKPA